MGPGGDPERPGRPASGPIRVGGPGPLVEAAPRRRSRRERRVDLVAGILLGLLIGLAVVAAFVFLGSEDTIDAPSISTPAGRDGGAGPGRPGEQPPQPVP